MKEKNKLNDVKWIFFDFDGTLVDSVPSLLQTYFCFLKKFGKNGTEKEFKKDLDGLSIPQIVSLLKKRYNLLENEQKLLEEYEKKVNKIYKKYVKPFKSAKEVLIKLKKNKNLVLITSAKEKYISELLEKFGWKKYFVFLIYGDGIKKTKPDPEIFINALKKIKVKPSEVVIIEDSANGVKAGKSAEISVIGISNNKDYRKMLKEHGAEIVVSDLAKILPILIKNESKKI